MGYGTILYLKERIMSNLDNFIKWYSNINQNKFKDSYSPHKPITILYALAKILKNERWIEYVDERYKLEDMIGAVSKTSPDCLQPLWRLQNDSKIHPFWEVIPKGNFEPNKSGDIPIGQAKEHRLKAGFSNVIFDWLKNDKVTAQILIDYILEDNFPETLTDELLNSMGVDEVILEVSEPESATLIVNRIKRDPLFPKKVMQAYDFRCCFCHLKLFLNHSPLPLEAAHIKWKARGGECIETNGLSLCPTHHYTFDKGIWSVDESMNIILNPKAAFDTKSDRFFTEFIGKPIASNLIDKKFMPEEEYLDWHRRNIFRT